MELKIESIKDMDKNTLLYTKGYLEGIVSKEFNRARRTLLSTFDERIQAGFCE